MLNPTGKGRALIKIALPLGNLIRSQAGTPGSILQQNSGPGEDSVSFIKQGFLSRARKWVSGRNCIKEATELQSCCNGKWGQHPTAQWLFRLLTCVNSFVYLEVFWAGELLPTAWPIALEWLLPCVNPQMVDKLVLGFERLALPIK